MIAPAYSPGIAHPLLPASDREGLRRGRALRERGIEDITRRHQPFMREGFRAIFEIGQKKPLLTADDVRKVVPDAYQPKHPNAWGALMVMAGKVGLIRRTGRRVPSVFPTNRARGVELWASQLYEPS